MSLKDHFLGDLNRLSGSGHHTIQATEKGRSLECELTDVDALACTYLHLTLKTDQLANATMEELQGISKTLSSRLTYLLEPLGPIESDTDQCVVQLRSCPPQRDDNAARYYELLVRRGGALVLCRYEKRSANQREVVPAAATKEVVARLIDDFLASVA